LKIHHGSSESRIRSGGLPPGLGYLGQQWSPLVESRPELVEILRYLDIGGNP